MKDATHFIEVWRARFDNIIYPYLGQGSDIMEISELEKELDRTTALGHLTIAVWKIKFKKTKHINHDQSKRISDCKLDEK